MGGKSSSRSSSQNNQRQITTTADNNQGVVASAGGDLNVNVLDGGAIEQSFAFASNALDEAFDYGAYATKQASELSAAALDEAFDFGGNALDTVKGVVSSAFNIVSKDRSEQYAQQQAALLEVSDRSRTETAQGLSEFTKYFFGTLGFLGLAAAVAYGVRK